jgi:RNA polymerase sigma factor (sigma-70 family)
MKDDPDRPPLYVASAEEIKDLRRRQALLEAVKETWPRIAAYSRAELPCTIDRDLLLDHVVSGVVRAETQGRVRDHGAYLFKSFVREARRLLRRSGKFEHLDPAALAVHPAVSDTSVEEKLEAAILTEEALAILDARTRMVCVLWSQGLRHKEIGKVVGMNPKAVQKQLERGIERMRQFIQNGPKNEPGPDR